MNIIKTNRDDVVVRQSAENLISLKAMSGVANVSVCIGEVDANACLFLQFAGTNVVNWIPLPPGIRPGGARELARGLPRAVDAYLAGVMNFVKTKSWPRDLVCGTHGSTAIPHQSMLWRFSEHGACDDVRRATRLAVEVLEDLEAGVIL